MYFERKTYTDKICKAVRSVPIVVLTGSRQVGKTTLMKNLPLKKQVLYLDGQDPDVAALFQQKTIIEKYLEIHLNEKRDGYLLIDEFQYINNISVLLKLLVDHNSDLRVICSGSSSIDILQKVEESLAGRVRFIEILPLSFEEYLMFTDNTLWQLFQKYDKNTINLLIDKKCYLIFTDYLIYGGMPRVALEKDTENKMDLLDDIYKTYLLKDVRQFVRNEDFVGFNKLLRLLAAQTGGIVNINKLSVETALSYKKTEAYLGILEQMYIIKMLEPYQTNNRKVITKMKKVYFLDLGLRNCIINDFNAIDYRIDNGALFENFVFLEIIRKIKKSDKIYFYRTLDGSEVDFVLDTLKGKVAIEVKFKSLTEPKFFKNLITFNTTENSKYSFVVNTNLNAESEGIRYIQGILINKLDF